MVPYRPNIIFLYDLAMVAKISIYDSYMASENPIWPFVRSFNAHTKLMQQFQLYRYLVTSLLGTTQIKVLVYDADQF